MQEEIGRLNRRTFRFSLAAIGLSSLTLWYRLAPEHFTTMIRAIGGALG